MLPRKNRVTTSRFEGLMTKGRLYHSAFFSLRTLALPSESRTRYSVVVSKKVAATAVKRNLYRRKLTNILYPLLPTSKKGINAVFFYKKDALKLNFKELTQEVTNLLKIAHILL